MELVASGQKKCQKGFLQLSQLLKGLACLLGPPTQVSLIAFAN